MITLRCDGGRYPGGLFPTPHDATTITATLEVRGGRLVLRIDDEAQMDRWEQFSAPLQGLLELLQAVRESG